jgi:phosphoribosylformylglycinamidine (FGAM) synthase PurS component
MVEIELLVRLKIPDVTALTAANSLRRRMGYEGGLVELRRADYYRLGLNVSSADEARALATELAEQTNLFVNPNKHVYELREPGASTAEPSGNGMHDVEVLVTDPSDGSAEGALTALQGRLGYGEQVASLVKGLLWVLRLKADDRETAKALAEEIALTRRIDQGLLVNPHFQECSIR